MKRLFDRKGLSSIEVVLVLPLLLGFLAASVDAYKIANSWVTLKGVVQEAASWGAGYKDDGTRPTPGEVQAKAQAIADQKGLAQVTFTVTSLQYNLNEWVAGVPGQLPTPHSDTLGQPGDHVMVDAQIQVQGLINMFFKFGQGSVQVKAKGMGIAS